MATHPLRTLLGQFRRTISVGDAADLTDAQLLERFVREQDERAFEACVWRHGPLVLGVCWRVLRNATEVEDAFQATFLLLARRAPTIFRRAAVASWLYKVAYRVALAQRRRLVRRLQREQHSPCLAQASFLVEPPFSEIHGVFAEELQRLPEKYRAPVVLCYLEGNTTDEAARQLGWRRGTVATRLAWARRRLAERLRARGMSLGAGLLTVALTEGAAAAGEVPLSLVVATVQAAIHEAAPLVSGAGAGAKFVTVATGASRMLWNPRIKLACVLGLSLALLGAGGWLVHRPQEVQAVAENAPTNRSWVYALVLVARQEPRLLADGPQHGAVGEHDFANFRKTQAALLKSRFILQAVMRLKAVAQLAFVRQLQDPVAWLESALQVDFPDDGELLRLSLWGDNQKELSKVLNAVTEVYLQEGEKARQGQVGARLAELERIETQICEKLRQQEATYKKMAEELGTSDVPTVVLKQQQLAQILGETRQALRRVRLDRAAGTARLRLAQADAKGNDLTTSGMIHKLMEEDAGLEAQETVLKEEFQQAEEQLSRMQLAGWRSSVELESLRSKIQQDERTLARLRSEIQNQTIELRAPSRIRLFQEATSGDAR